MRCDGPECEAEESGDTRRADERSDITEDLLIASPRGDDNISCRPGGR